MPTHTEPHPVFRNRILTALLDGAQSHLTTKLERVNLALGEVIYMADESIQYVYFPETAVISMLVIMENGDTAEVGMVGNEGMVSLRVFFGAISEPDAAMVQIPGTAMRMKADLLNEELRPGTPLQELLLRYTQSLMRQISQSAACNVHHTIEQRLARWLLMMFDYVETHRLHLTQEFISMMMGNRRASISEAATNLQRAGLLKHSRGYITLADRVGLEAATCECYRVIKDDYSRLNAETPALIAKERVQRAQR